MYITQLDGIKTFQAELTVLKVFSVEFHNALSSMF